MDDDVPDAEQAPKARAKWPHDWNTYEEYRTVHASYMEGLIKEGIVYEERLTFREITYRSRIVQVQIHGHIQCARDVIIIVDKLLDAERDWDGRLIVKGSEYSYHAYIRSTSHSVIRYDCHGEHGLSSLHKHTFNPKTGKELDSEPIELDDLPSLAEVIRDAVERAPE